MPCSWLTFWQALPRSASNPVNQSTPICSMPDTSQRADYAKWANMRARQILIGRWNSVLYNAAPHSEAEFPSQRGLPCGCAVLVLVIWPPPPALGLLHRRIRRAVLETQCAAFGGMKTMGAHRGATLLPWAAALPLRRGAMGSRIGDVELVNQAA